MDILIIHFIKCDQSNSIKNDVKNFHKIIEIHKSATLKPFKNEM